MKGEQIVKNVIISLSENGLTIKLKEIYRKNYERSKIYQLEQMASGSHWKVDHIFLESLEGGLLVQQAYSAKSKVLTSYPLKSILSNTEAKSDIQTAC